jgi:hypothetical protein
MEKVFAPVVLLRNRLYTIYIGVTLILIIGIIFACHETIASSDAQ